MSVQQDVAVARAAAAEIQRAVEGLRKHYPDSVDVRRLAVDAERIAEDIDLLAGPVDATGPPPTLMVIEDREYPPDFFQGAEAEGIGPR